MSCRQSDTDVELGEALLTQHCREASSEMVRPGAAIGSDSMIDADESDVRVEDVSTEHEYYSVVVAKLTWFEVSFQRVLPKSFGSEDMLVPTDSSGTILYAVPMIQELPHVVASRVRTDGVLYICVHNPLVDTHIVEMQELVKKANRTVALVVILPAVEFLDEELALLSRMRVHGDKDTRYMASFVDLHAWFMLLSTGVFSSLALVLPFITLKSLQTSRVWSIATSTVTTKILDGSHRGTLKLCNAGSQNDPY